MSFNVITAFFTIFIPHVLNKVPIHNNTCTFVGVMNEYFMLSLQFSFLLWCSGL